MRSCGPLKNVLFAAAVLRLLAASGPAIAGPPSQVPNEEWLDAVVNGVERHYTVLLLRKGSEIYLRDLDMAELGLSIPAGQALVHEGERFHASSSAVGLHIETNAIPGRALFDIPRGDREHRGGAEDGHWLLETTVNGVDTKQLVAASGQADDLRVSLSDLRAAGIKVPQMGSDYLRLRSMPHLRYVIDTREQRLLLLVPASLLNKQQIDFNTRRPEVPSTTTVPGLAVDYELDAQHDGHGADVAGLLEASAFGGSTEFRSQYAFPFGATQPVRLDTTLVHDQPAQGLRLELGDTISRGGSLTLPVHFAGVHWGTERAVQPWLQRMAPVAIEGEAVLPGQVDVYVNGLHRGSQQVAPGPFDLITLPDVNGAGTVRAIVRDVLDRTQVITDDFYADTRLLAAGRSEWSVEGGAVRKDYGYASDHYGDSFVLGDWRYGANSALTFEGHAEAWSGHAVAGGAVNASLGSRLLATAGILQDEGGARAYTYSLEHAGRTLRAGVFGTATDLGFRQVGRSFDASASRRTLNAYANANLGRLTLGVRRLRWTPFQGEPSAIWALQAILPVGRGLLQLLASQPDGAPDQREVSLVLNLPLDDGRISFDASVDETPNGAGWTTGLQHNAPLGPGVGYRIDTGLQGGELVSDGFLAVNGMHGDLHLQAYRNGDQPTLARSSVRGSLVVADGGIYASRWLDGPFAVADVGAADVGVTLNNELVARTSADGSALVPGLVAYQRNVVGVRNSDIPLGVPLDRVQADVVPPLRSGVKVTFSANRRLYLLHLADSRGAPLPAGALIDWDGGASAVGFEGLTAIEGSPGQQLQLHVHWSQTRCVAQIRLPDASSRNAATLGTFFCL